MERPAEAEVFVARVRLAVARFVSAAPFAAAAPPEVVLSGVLMALGFLLWSRFVSVRFVFGSEVIIEHMFVNRGREIVTPLFARRENYPLLRTSSGKR